MAASAAATVNINSVKTQSYLRQISRERNEGVELIDVETKKGVKIDA